MDKETKVGLVLGMVTIVAFGVWLFCMSIHPDCPAPCCVKEQ